MLIALAISAVLLTAVAVALDASFRAYGSAAEQASAQSATRMVSHRLIALVRSATAHGPLEADAPAGVSVLDNLVTTPYIEMVEPDGDVLRITYDDENDQLTLSINDGDEQPLLTGVTSGSFQLARTRTALGGWELDYASIDFTVEANPDQTLALEAKDTDPLRVIASVAPRKLN